MNICNISSLNFEKILLYILKYIFKFCEMNALIHKHIKNENFGEFKNSFWELFRYAP